MTDLLKVPGLDHALTLLGEKKNILVVVNVKSQPSSLNFKNTHTAQLPSASLHSGFSRQLSRSSDLDRWRGAQSQLCLPLEMILLIGRSSGAVNPQHLLASAGCGEDNKHYLEFLFVSLYIVCYWKLIIFFAWLCHHCRSHEPADTSRQPHYSSIIR